MDQYVPDHQTEAVPHYGPQRGVTADPVEGETDGNSSGYGHEHDQVHGHLVEVVEDDVPADTEHLPAKETRTAVVKEG